MSLRVKFWQWFDTANWRGVIVIVAIFFALSRIAGVHNDVFKDCAHVYMGGLAGWWFRSKRQDRFVFWLFWTLCVIEVVCAAVSRLSQLVYFGYQSSN